MSDDGEPWPIGDWLRRHREDAGMSKRGAAAAAGISEGRWRQLELGWAHVTGGKVPITTTAPTVIKAALAVHGDPREALTAAGFNPAIYRPAENPDRSSPTTDDVGDLVARLDRAQQDAVRALVVSMLPPESNATVLRAAYPESPEDEQA